ncbi:hypothetical protein GCM10017056_09250 [Seohaeicola zhoushanensis]|uniref:Rifampin ADP-ribosyltransferase domain-containing protein n=1 Tax=Seohaeicola zhoushanensis TaxID=1569283 RepID=A0A8J3GVI8_9RHOB|nr:NAD(+)--rifampin ADP-ribosyltransferase [Seohaeicola zhoushanensis]GHF39854.1 hypothetical protein GCM10017056_09250 [Seohaeicola zhoushanensis]
MPAPTTPARASRFCQSFFHGTKAALQPGDEMVVGHPSAFSEGDPLSWVYFTATLDAAIWGAELARGDGPGRIYVVEPTGPVEDDPNLTDRKFPGNPTLSFRSRAPLRIIAEVTGWAGHAPDQLREMREGLACKIAEGAEIIDCSPSPTRSAPRPPLLFFKSTSGGGAPQARRGQRPNGPDAHPKALRQAGVNSHLEI